MNTITSESRLQHLAAALEAQGLASRIQTNGRGTPHLEVADHIIFWEEADAEFVIASGRDSAFVPAGSDAEAVAQGVAAKDARHP